MPKSVFTDAYGTFAEYLVELRRREGVSQAELARRLGKPQQFVSYVERRERRLDVIEFYAFARALGVDPVHSFAELVARFPETVSI